jgi:hypothetical protein
MTARKYVASAFQVLCLELPQVEKHWRIERHLLTRWKNLSARLLDLLDAYDRCRSDEDWKMLQLRLEDLLRGHGLRAMLENVTGEDSPVVDFRWPSAYRGPNDGGSSAAFGADLADVLRRICEQALSEPDLPPLTAYPEARIEGGVVASQPFWLEVMARADPTGMNTEPLVLQRPGSSQLAVEVVVDLPSDGSLVERSPLVHPLVIPTGSPSNWLRPGRASINSRSFSSNGGC